MRSFVKNLFLITLLFGSIGFGNSLHMTNDERLFTYLFGLPLKIANQGVDDNIMNFIGKTDVQNLECDQYKINDVNVGVIQVFYCNNGNEIIASSGSHIKAVAKDFESIGKNQAGYIKEGNCYTNQLQNGATLALCSYKHNNQVVLIKP